MIWLKSQKKSPEEPAFSSKRNSGSKRFETFESKEPKNFPSIDQAPSTEEFHGLVHEHCGNRNSAALS